MRKLHEMLINDAYFTQGDDLDDCLEDLYGNQDFFTWKAFPTRNEVPDNYKCDVIVIDCGQIDNFKIIMYFYLKKTKYFPNFRQLYYYLKNQ